MKIALLGDIHGRSAHHLKVIGANEYTLQIGDCGFDYDYLDGVDPIKHKVLGGNHDNYPRLQQWPHYLGDFGMWNGLFYVRGAWSIDQMHRTPGKNWWAEEELTIEQGEEALRAYAKAKPMYVVTHDGPAEVTAKLESMFPELPRHQTRTGMLLDTMLKIHRPYAWYFGHWHQAAVIPWKGTNFRCIDINEVVEVDIHPVGEYRDDPSEPLDPVEEGFSE